MSVTFTVLLDKRRLILKSCKYPLKLRVTHRRKSKEYEIVHKLSEEDFNKLGAPRLSAPLQQVKDDLRAIEMMMADAIRKISPFDFWDFWRDYIDKNPLFKQKKVKPGDKLLAKPSSFDFAPYYKKFPYCWNRKESMVPF